MASHAQAADPIYQTITGGKIPLSSLSEAEYGYLDMVAKKFSSKQDWTRFAAWWNAKFSASGLPTTSVVYRICQDLEARLGINQGKVSPPDYRDYLAELIDAQFGSRLEFCRATGVDPGQLSLSEAEYGFLNIVAKKYGPKQDWTRFAAWWNAKWSASGLPTSSVVYRICQDLEARLGINQGKVSPRITAITSPNSSTPSSARVWNFAAPPASIRGNIAACSPAATTCR